MLCCAVFLLIPFLGQLGPQAIHFGRKRLSDFPEQQRPQVLDILSRMAGCMNLVMNLLLADLLRQVIQASKESTPQIHPVLPLIVGIACMAGTSIYFMVQIRSLAVNSVA